MLTQIILYYDRVVLVNTKRTYSHLLRFSFLRFEHIKIILLSIDEFICNLKKVKAYIRLKRTDFIKKFLRNSCLSYEYKLRNLNNYMLLIRKPNGSLYYGKRLICQSYFLSN
jgi:hypothetical protein